MRGLMLGILVCLGLVLKPAPAEAQIREDRKAEQLWLRGKSLFENAAYGEALDQLNQLLERRYNTLTTPALYLSGLCYYYLNQPQQGVSQLQRLLVEYPGSVYAEEATYHKALMMLNVADTRQGGLYLLSQLMQQASRPDVSRDARTAYLHFLYEQAELDFLLTYYELAKTRPDIRFVVLEALCYRLFVAKEFELLTHFLDEYQRERGSLNDRLKRLLVQVPQNLKARQIKVALLLPFNAHRTSPVLSQVSIWSQELLAGIRMALEHLGDSLRCDMELRVFDTQESEERTRKLISSQLETYAPDLIVGDLLNGPSKVLAEYAEKHKTVQVIPLSPVDELIRNRNYVYLANPSMSLQMRSLARYAINHLKSSRFLIISDGTALSNRQVKEFGGELRDSGFTFLQHQISDNYDLEYRRLRTILAQMKSQQIETVFIASDNESLVAFVLRQFDADNLLVRVLGSTDWYRFHVIDRRLLALYEATFVCNYFVQNDPGPYGTFAEAYRQRYRRSPGMAASLGYDLSRYFLAGRFAQPGVNQWQESIRKAKPWRGLIQNYYYAGGQANQSIQLLQYRETGLEKLKLWR